MKCPKIDAKHLIILFCLCIILAIIGLSLLGCATTPIGPPIEDGPQGDWYEADLTPDSDGSELED